RRQAIEMVDSTRSPSSGCELAVWGVRGARRRYLDGRNVTATGSPREADAPVQRPLAAAEPAREPDAAKGSRSRTREIVESTIWGRLRTGRVRHGRSRMGRVVRARKM